MLQPDDNGGDGISGWQKQVSLLEERLRLATTAASIGVWDWHVSENLLVWDEQMYRLYGVKQEDFKGTYDAWLQCIHPEDQVRCHEAIQLAIRGERPYNIEFRIVRQDGELRFIKADGIVKWDDAGGPLRLTGTSYDITVLKRAVLESSASLMWKNAVLHAAAYAIISTSPDGVIQTFNPAAERMLGYRADEVIGKLTPAIIHDPQEVAQRAEVFSRELQQQIEPGFEVFAAKARRDLPNEYQWTYIRKDGTRFPALLSVTALRDSNGTIVGFLGLASDISMRKKAEEDIRAYARELEIINNSLDQALETAQTATLAKSAFLATMSHEIRTPMNGVIGMIGLLLDTNLSPEQRQYAETVRNSGQHLLTIINDILDFSKIEAGKLVLETIAFDLRQTTEEAIDLVASSATEKGLNLACLVSADVPSALRGDPGRLRQILLNLLSNAIKFSHQGDVVLSLTVAQDSQEEAVVRFEVQDSGIGLSEEQQAGLFQAFTQADSSTTRKFGGTGLGLAICKQLTEQMGGTIGVQSRMGEGSIFWFTVRLAKQSNCPHAMPDEKSAVDLRGRWVCIVEPNATNRLAIESYAKACDIQSQAAQNGPQALTLLRQMRAQGHVCEFAIVSCQGLEMDELDLARSIKADPLIASTRLILLTTHGQRGDARAAQQAGYDAYLTKPIRESQLRECFRALLRSDGHNENDARPCVEAEAHDLVTRHSLADAKSSTLNKVLVVEDNPINQKVAVRMLEKLGCRVDVAGNGLEAIKALEQISYRVVLMDCHMPEMDGYVATRRIRERETSLKMKRIPIIALTASAMEDDRERCIAAGMDDYLTKPIQGKELSAKLSRWVDLERPAVRQTSAPVEYHPA